MAYFSGNAIYIRNTMNQNEIGKICGGIHIEQNVFKNNIGMKMHNGGAISLVCTIISNQKYQNYFSSSAYMLSGYPLDPYLDVYVNVYDFIYPKEYYVINPFRVSIINCTFIENYSGQKGTAVYINQISRSQIKNCQFINNGPVLSYFETFHSPYTYYYSKRTMTYYDEFQKCLNEFDYYVNCQRVGNFIDSSHIQGAVYVGHCQLNVCMNVKNIMSLLILNSVFQGNQVGYFMDSKFISNLAAGIYIDGGYNNSLRNLTFNDNYGQYELLLQLGGNKLLQFFPTNYFKHLQGSLIYVGTNPLIDVSQTTIFDLATEIVKCQFQRNKHYQAIGLAGINFYGSLISFQSNYGKVTTNFVPTLSIVQSTFIDNYFIGDMTSLIYISNGLLFLKNSIFYNNGMINAVTLKNSPQNIGVDPLNFNFAAYKTQMQQTYGLIYIQGDQKFSKYNVHIIQNNSFMFSFADQGSVFYTKVDDQFIQIYQNQYKFNFASTQGSIISGQSSSVKSTVHFINETISYQFTNKGVMSIQSLTSLQVNNSNFINIIGYNGASLYMDEAGTSFIQNCTFSQEDSYKQNLSQYILKNFKQFSSPLSTFIDEVALKIFINEDITQNGQIFLQNNVELSVYNCNFQNLYSEVGGVFYINLFSKVFYYNDSDKKYGIKNCSTGDKGVIMLSTYSEFYGQNLLIQNSHSNLDAGAVLIESNSNATFVNVQFLNNSAENNGLFFISGSSILNCLQCSFIKNKAQDGSIIFADNNPNGSIMINNSVFVNNTSKSNMFNLLYSNIYVANSNFTNNIAEVVNHGITMIGTNGIIDNIRVNYNDFGFVNNNPFQVNSGFFNLNYQSVINISNSVFQNCRGSTASVLYATGTSIINIQNHTIFKDCVSLIGGSSLYFTSTQAVHIENSTFLNNGIVDIIVNNANATIMTSAFINGSQQFIYATQASIFLEQNWIGNGSNFGIQGKGVYCDCINMVAKNNTFYNLSAVQGGAIYLTSTNSDTGFVFSGNRFEKNQAQQGGAIFIQDAVKLEMLNNTFFQNAAYVISPSTSASQKLSQKGLGGSIYFACDNQDIPTLFNKCKVSFKQDNYFIENNATNDGGAIIWVQNNFTDDQSTKYWNNSAQYGNDIASYPKSLQISHFKNNDIENPITLDRLNQTRRLDIQLTQVLEGVSGQEFELVIQIIDQNGNIYKTDNDSIATIEPVGNSNALIKNNEVLAKNGQYNFSSVTVYIPPNNNLTCSLQISGIQTYNNDLTFLNSPIQLSFYYRACKSGEELQSNNACQKCGNNSFLFDAPNVTTSCIICDSHSICYGGSVVAPKDGYWRSSNVSKNFILCPRPASCLAGNQSYPIGICQSGYQGVICGACESGYSKGGNFKCSQCPDKTRNIVYIVLIMLAIIGYVTFLVRSTINSIGKEKPLYSVYVKILTNHFQIIGAISNIQFSWPSQIEAFFDAQSQPSSASQQIFSFDCFLMNSGSAANSTSNDDTQSTGGISVYFFKLLIIAFLPFILAIADIAFWVAWLTFKNRKQKEKYNELKNSFITTLVILMFLVHPNISAAMFSSFNCLDIDGIQYLRDDVRFVCYEGTHLLYVLIISLPCIICWSIGIPLFTLILLIKSKKAISLQDKKTLTPDEDKALQQVKFRFGFLFLGYKSSHFYWEVLILYRKIAIAMIAVFFSVVSPEVQILLVLMIVILNWFAYYRFSPFMTSILNRMEILSLFVVCITLYVGMYFVTGVHYSYMDNDGLKWFLLLALVIPNAMFFLFWLFEMYIEIVKIAYSKGVIPYKAVTLGMYDYQKFGKKFMTEEQLKTMFDNQLRIMERKLKYLEEQERKRKQRKKKNKDSFLGRFYRTSKEDESEDSDIVEQRRYEADLLSQVEPDMKKYIENQNNLPVELQDIKFQLQNNYMDFQDNAIKKTVSKLNKRKKRFEEGKFNSVNLIDQKEFKEDFFILEGNDEEIDEKTKNKIEEQQIPEQTTRFSNLRQRSNRYKISEDSSNAVVRRKVFNINNFNRYNNNMGDQANPQENKAKNQRKIRAKRFKDQSSTRVLEEVSNFTADPQKNYITFNQQSITKITQPNIIDTEENKQSSDLGEVEEENYQPSLESSIH